MTYKNIILEKKGKLATIIVNRPQVLNALNKETINELTEAVSVLEKEKQIKVVIIKGSGEKAFIAGADIKEMKDMSVLEARKFSELGHNLLDKIRQSRLPYIAMINGYALGGGCELLMACDITIASKTAKLGQPEINLGISPGFCGTQCLPRLVGRAKAKEMMLTGDAINAEEAYRIGLITQIVEPAELEARTLEVAYKIASKSSVQTSFIKSLVNKGADIDMHSACALEVSYFSSGFSTYDQKEGMEAFLEKRKPNFKGR
jgi:enoyl-CoA hydratase